MCRGFIVADCSFDVLIIEEKHNEEIEYYKLKALEEIKGSRYIKNREKGEIFEVSCPTDWKGPRNWFVFKSPS